MPQLVTSTLAIGDTGCATSMAPHDDFMESGSIYKSEVNVIGAARSNVIPPAPMRSTLWYPMESDAHGIVKYTEKDSILNNNCCPYILIAIGRASFEIEAALYMPGGSGNGTIAFRGGVTVTVYQCKVLALRPLGYKVPPVASMSALHPEREPAERIHVPDKGDFNLHPLPRLRPATRARHNQPRIRVGRGSIHRVR